MPFYDNVYYPLTSESAQSSPSLLSSPWLPHHSSIVDRMPSSSHGSSFKFRSRHDSVDWRRIGAIDVDRVAHELDFLTLQTNIMNITFCNVENERCPHCQNSLDPILLKLFRLAQFTIEYLLHSQEYLTSNLQTLEEKMQATFNETEQMQLKMFKLSEEVKSLKEECKRRKKIISTQQTMINAGTSSYHKCPHCDKAFMNYSFLQCHTQRRHPEGASSEKQKLQASDNLQHEVTQLKEELQLTKYQLETEQSAQIERLIKFQEIEQRKSIEQEILKKFDHWKEEEKEKLADEMNKLKLMFMTEFKELTAKNTSLERKLQELKKDKPHITSGLGTLQVSPQEDQDEGRPRCPHDIENVKKLLEIQENRWGNRIQLLRQEHDKEKNQLLSQVENLRLSTSEDQKASNAFYKQRLDQLGQKLQEQNELMKMQKEQIKELSVKPSASIKKHSVPVSTLQHVETKPSISLTRVPVSTLQHVETKPSISLTRDLEIEESPSTSQPYLINSLKKNPSLTKELRSVLEQGLTEKLESLGIKPGVRGIQSDHLNRILDSMESHREEKEKLIPEIQHIRESLSRQVNIKAEKRASSSSCKLASSISQLSTDVVKWETLGSASSVLLQKPSKPKAPILKSSQDELQLEQRYPIPVKSSTPKTPPFSSDDESYEDDIPLLSHKPTDSSKPKLCFTRKSNIDLVESDSEGSLLEEFDPKLVHKQNIQKAVPVKPARATMVKELTEQIEKKLSSHSIEKKPFGGVAVAQAFVNKDEVMELKVTDFDDDFDRSSLEEETFEVPRSVTCRQGAAIYKHDLPAAPVKNAFGLHKLLKGEVREADTSCTLVSSLVTVSDFTDSSDV
ncbi:cilium assembly protein DZIP1 isoform X5 [Ascaphus truei]|uniref:cilium assembly protein DZIP1 isoform X5 n=1 Tax=Ascaphus truei TaxID=8439 RepID=UPI003F5AD49B